MRNRTDSTCRQAWRLRRQVLHGPPTKGDLAASLVAVETGCKASRQIPALRGERISAEVSWVQPRENGPSGPANAADQICPFGVGHRMPRRSSSPRSRCWWGSVPPGPAVVLGEVPAVNGQRGKRQLILPWVSRAEESTLILPCQDLGAKDRGALEKRSVLVSRDEATDKSTSKHPSATDC
jgi:hypothetical protein